MENGINIEHENWAQDADSARVDLDKMTEDQLAKRIESEKKKFDDNQQEFAKLLRSEDEDFVEKIADYSRDHSARLMVGKGGITHEDLDAAYRRLGVTEENYAGTKENAMRVETLRSLVDEFQENGVSYK